jgi:hypothetical protein
MEHTLVDPESDNQDEYVGHVPSGQLTGTGIFRCAKNGAVYRGEYEGNRFHGIGELTWSDEDVYRGQFKGGLKEGSGVFTWADGDVHTGQWKGGVREGVGVFTFADGRVYRGQFKGDKMEGDAVYTFADGRQTFDRWEGGEEVLSMPFEAANPAHAAVLRAANEAEARRVGTPRLRRA